MYLSRRGLTPQPRVAAAHPGRVQDTKRLADPEGVIQARAGSLSNPFGVDVGDEAFCSQGALPRPWAVE
jgi:hypothetical protein